MSVFNPTALQNLEITGAMDTTIIPIDEGDFTGVIDKYEIRVIDSTKNGETKSYVACEVHWNIDDEEQKAKTGRDKLTVRQSIFLDMTPTGNLDLSRGKNVQLGRLREALGQNSPNKPWSFGMLVGQVATVSVKQRVLEDGTITNDIRKVAAM